jgi:tetratricopeptide (TPR) repeat protein
MAAPPVLDPARQTRLAQDVLGRVEEYRGAGLFWDAIQLLQATLPQLQEQPLRDKAHVALARLYLKNPKWGHRVEEILQKMVQENPLNTEPYLMLAEIYEERGVRSRAQAMYSRVLEVRPGHRLATERLRALGGPEPPEDGPPVKKLFRKP